MGIRIRECEVVYRTRSLPDVASRKVVDSGSVYRLVPELLDRAHESLVVLLLDSRHNVVGKHEAARGNASSCMVEPCTVFRAAVISNAGAIILVHNHPSGELSPSPEDLALTRKLVEAGEVLGVKVLDHVIVHEGGFFSMQDSGLMPKAAA